MSAEQLGSQQIVFVGFRFCPCFPIVFEHSKYYSFVASDLKRRKYSWYSSFPLFDDRLMTTRRVRPTPKETHSGAMPNGLPAKCHIAAITPPATIDQKAASFVTLSQ